MASAIVALRRIVELSSFAILQDKLETWLVEYAVNTCDQNVSQCMDIIELNSRMQSHLFTLLGLASADGGVYGGASVIKSRLLPWLSSLQPGYIDSAISQVVAKERELREFKEFYDRSLEDLETDLNLTKSEANDLKIELALKNDELENERRKSSSDKMFTQKEVSELRTKIESLEKERVLARSDMKRGDSYERQIARLRDELFLINGQRMSYFTRRSPVQSDQESPTVQGRQGHREQKLITRYNDMFTIDRINAIDMLCQFTDIEDHENNQRIVFATIQESFRVTRMAFTEYKMKIRTRVAVTHSGPDTLEEAVQAYIDRHWSEPCETATLVDDVVRALNRKPNLYLPNGVSFSVLHSFIRESCQLAWNMFALPRPLDIAPAASLELFDDTKYRRTYDSDVSAPLVTQHIWPCLLQGSAVIVKGEARATRGIVMIDQAGKQVRDVINVR